MTVQDLMDELAVRNPEEEITVWDAKTDRETEDVHLSDTPTGLLISSTE